MPDLQRAEAMQAHASLSGSSKARQCRTGAQRSSGWPGAHMGVLTSGQRSRQEHGEPVVAAEDTGQLTCARQP